MVRDIVCADQAVRAQVDGMDESVDVRALLALSAATWRVSQTKKAAAMPCRYQ